MKSVHRDAPVLMVEGLNVSFGHDDHLLRIVRDVDLRIERNETVAIVGESGSGKTLTTLAVLGLVDRIGGTVTAERILFEGIDLLGAKDATLRSIRGAGIGTVFQQPLLSLDPAYTVGAQIAETIRIHEKVSRKNAWASAVDLLGRVQIPNPSARAHEYPHQLSGGMCQRVMIAIAIACQPTLLIADEPTTALDVRTQASFLALLNSIRDEFGMSVLYVSHDLAVVSEIADRVTVMYAGEIVEVADTSVILERPEHPYTSGLISSAVMPLPGERFEAIRGQIPAAGSVGLGCQFANRCDHVVDECRSAPIPLTAGENSSHVRCVRSKELVLRGAR